MKNQQGITGAKRLVACQLILTALIFLGCLIVLGNQAALSALLGGLVCTLPNAYFARKMFEYAGARAAKQIVNNFYKGEGLKIALSIILFTVALKFFNIIPLVFFIVYLVVQMVFWFAPLMFTGYKYRPESD